MNTSTGTIDESRVFSAYLVMFVSNEQRTIDHLAIHSEPSPTCPTTHRTEVLFETRGSSYADARREMDAIIRAAIAAQGCA